MGGNKGGDVTAEADWVGMLLDDTDAAPAKAKPTTVSAPPPDPPPSARTAPGSSPSRARGSAIFQYAQPKGVMLSPAREEIRVNHSITGCSA